MALIGLLGRRNNTNMAVLQYAIAHTPSFIVDCANVADPHKFSGKISPELFASIYSIIAESIYRFRDSLLNIEHFLQAKHIKHICITSFDRLFNYQGELENKNIYAHAWELMANLANTYEVYVAVPKSQFHVAQAKVHCTQLIEVEENHGTHRSKPTYRYRQLIE